MPRKPKTSSGKQKLKTHKATAKRFRLTGTGLVVRTKKGKSHLRRRTSARTSAQFRETQVVLGKKFIQRVKRLAPYMKKFKANPPA